METNFTIPVNEAFEASRDNHALGCPLCNLYEKLQNDELDIILGAAFMEPDIRMETNREGFCRYHYGKMFGMKNRLGMALTMESHLDELAKDLSDGGIGGGMGAKPMKRIARLEESCYICRRINTNFDHMSDTVLYLWEKDEDFRKKTQSQPYFCLPHEKKLLEIGAKRLSKKMRSEFAKDIEAVNDAYLEELKKDVSWFCKKFDYRFDKEPWYNSRDAVERCMNFLRGKDENAK